MRISDWLDGRVPAPPDALAARIREKLGSVAAEEVESLPPRFIEIATTIARGVVSDGRQDRSTATDLLIADALVTYAFEYAAASGPGTLDMTELTRRSMTGLALVAEAGR
jgi:hypothetical protein